jgi:transcriptional regulator with XRE-family HTH domain
MNHEQLRRHRKRLGFTVAKAAAQVHVAPRTWINWESGKTEVPDTAAHLFALLHKLPFKARKGRG